MADRFELLRARFRGAQQLLRLVEAPLLHQRTAEDELSGSDVEQEVFATLEQVERVPRLLFGRLHLTGHQVTWRERRDDVRRLGCAALLEQDAIRVLQVRDRLLGLAELEAQSAEVVE